MQHVLVVEYSPAGGSEHWSDTYGPFDTWSEADEYRTFLGTFYPRGDVRGRICYLQPPVRSEAELLTHPTQRKRARRKTA